MTTPPPVYTAPNIPAAHVGDRPVPMTHEDRARLRTAASRATRLYPGPVGELVSRELLTWDEFGYRLGGGQLVMRLIDHILAAPLPDPPVAAEPKPRVTARVFPGIRRPA